MGYFLLGLLGLACITLMLRLYASTSPATLIRVAQRTAMISAALGALLLLLRIPVGSTLLGIGAVIPLMLRWRALWPVFAGEPSQQARKTSRIDTKYLRMALDHDTGTLDGLVLAGKYCDSLLSKLTLEQLLEVRVDCLAGDPEGVPLIEAYLDRVHGPDWRTTGSSQQSSGNASSRTSSGAMTRDEALKVLGLAPTASEAEIREAYHQLILKLHPDHGGSDYLAAKVNQAKDVLLGT
jgi:hypothetical protein